MLTLKSSALFSIIWICYFIKIENSVRHMIWAYDYLFISLCAVCGNVYSHLDVLYCRPLFNMWRHSLPQRPSCLTSPISPQWRRWSTVFLALASAQVTVFHRPGKSVSCSLEHLHVVAIQNIVQNNVYFVLILFKTLAWWPHQMSETIDPECTPLLCNCLEYFEVEVVTCGMGVFACLSLTEPTKWSHIRLGLSENYMYYNPLWLMSAKIFDALDIYI